MATKNSELRAEVLTQEAFSAFGDVIEVGDTKETRTINEGNTLRYHDLARLTLSSESGQPAISIFRSQPQTLPFEIKLMERHPLSSQAFFPLGTESYLVVVAPAGELKSDKIRAFIASSHQGVNYHPGTWHHSTTSRIFLSLIASCSVIRTPMQIVTKYFSTSLLR